MEQQDWPIVTDFGETITLRTFILLFPLSEAKSFILTDLLFPTFSVMSSAGSVAFCSILTLFSMPGSAAGVPRLVKIFLLVIVGSFSGSNCLIYLQCLVVKSPLSVLMT